MNGTSNTFRPTPPCPGALGAAGAGERASGGEPSGEHESKELETGALREPWTRSVEVGVMC